MSCEHCPRRSESGSAYIITLLALVVLTIIGLGLSLITQTELQVGAAEVTQQRLLYAADAGVSAAAARAIGRFDCRPTGTDDTNPNVPQILQIYDQDNNGVLGLQADLHEDTSLSPVMPMPNMHIPCALCQINDTAGGGQYGQPAYYEVHHVVTAEAKRYVGGNVAAVRDVGAMIAVQPWPEIGDCFAFQSAPQASQVKM